MTKKGTLHLFPCPIAEGVIEVIPDYAISAIKKIDFFIAERAKTTRRFLKQINHPLPLSEIEIFELDKKNALLYKEEWSQKLLEGKDVGLFSEAGTPCIADPGEEITSHAHHLQVNVKPYVGPNSILLAIMASGLNGEQFHFHTYLPINLSEIRTTLKQISQSVVNKGVSHIFIETPYRNEKTFETILKECPNNIYLCIASNLTHPNESIISKSIKDWKKSNKPQFHKIPSIFILGLPQS